MAVVRNIARQLNHIKNVLFACFENKTKKPCMATAAQK